MELSERFPFQLESALEVMNPARRGVDQLLLEPGEVVDKATLGRVVIPPGSLHACV